MNEEAFKMNRSEMENSEFIPITSEVSIGRGTLLKEISTGKFFGVRRRIMKDPEVSGEPVWEIDSLESNEHTRKTLGRLQLSGKFLASVNV